MSASGPQASPAGASEVPPGPVVPEATDLLLVRRAAEALDVEAAAILREDPRLGPEVSARWPEAEAPPGAGLSLEPVRRVLTEGATVALDECAELAGLLEPPAPLTGVAVPVWGAAAVDAALVLGGRDAGRRLSPVEVRLANELTTAALLERQLATERGAAERASARLANLIDAGMALAGELSLDELLERLVETAREVLGARYAALGVLNAERTELDRFITAGVTEAQREAIGALPRGRGILGVLVRDARTLRLARIADDPRSVGFPSNHPPMESFLGVPVALRGEVYGNLYLTEKVGGLFTDEDEQVAQTLAAQAAVAIDNAGRYEAERSRISELESVQEVARAVHAVLDIDQLLPLVARHARRLTGADTVGIAVSEEDVMTVRYAHGLNALELESMRLPLELPAVVAALREELGAPTAQVEPLELGGSLVGVLAAVGSRPFDEAARRLLQTLASQAAVALRNARAVAEERERLLGSAELKAAHAREKAAEESLRRAIDAQEAERARIARELHDEVGQVLTGLALHLRALESHMVDDEGRDRLADLRHEVTLAATGLRELATELRPSGLREHGLASAIERQAARVAEASEIPVAVAVDALPTGMPEEVEILIFRVVQEALTNVSRHSGAGHASVLAMAHAGRLRVVVEDDGRGFDPSHPTERLGLAGIRERVGLLGGTLRVESAPGAGSAVIVDLEVP